MSYFTPATRMLSVLRYKCMQYNFDYTPGLLLIMHQQEAQSNWLSKDMHIY